ncbi:MAG: hypothetical protein V1779_05715 [bacterium]
MKKALILFIILAICILLPDISFSKKKEYLYYKKTKATRNVVENKAVYDCETPGDSWCNVLMKGDEPVQKVRNFDPSFIYILDENNKAIGKGKFILEKKKNMILFEWEIFNDLKDIPTEIHFDNFLFNNELSKKILKDENKWEIREQTSPVKRIKNKVVYEINAKIVK